MTTIAHILQRAKDAKLEEEKETKARLRAEAQAKANELAAIIRENVNSDILDALNINLGKPHWNSYEKPVFVGKFDDEDGNQFVVTIERNAPSYQAWLEIHYTLSIPGNSDQMFKVASVGIASGRQTSQEQTGVQIANAVLAATQEAPVQRRAAIEKIINSLINDARYEAYVFITEEQFDLVKAQKLKARLRELQAAGILTDSDAATIRQHMLTRLLAQRQQQQRVRNQQRALAKRQEIDKLIEAAALDYSKLIQQYQADCKTWATTQNELAWANAPQLWAVRYGLPYRVEGEEGYSLPEIVVTADEAAEIIKDPDRKQYWVHNIQYNGEKIPIVIFNVVDLQQINYFNKERRAHGHLRYCQTVYAHANTMTAVYIPPGVDFTPVEPPAPPPAWQQWCADRTGYRTSYDYTQYLQNRDEEDPY